MGLLLLLLLFLSVREQANSYPWCLWARDMATGEQVQAPPPEATIRVRQLRRAPTCGCACQLLRELKTCSL